MPRQRTLLNWLLVDDETRKRLRSQEKKSCPKYVVVREHIRKVPHKGAPSASSVAVGSAGSSHAPIIISDSDDSAENLPPPLHQEQQEEVQQQPEEYQLEQQPEQQLLEEQLASQQSGHSGDLFSQGSSVQILPFNADQEQPLLDNAAEAPLPPLNEAMILFDEIFPILDADDNGQIHHDASQNNDAVAPEDVQAMNFIQHVHNLPPLIEVVDWDFVAPPPQDDVATQDLQHTNTFNSTFDTQ